MNLFVKNLFLICLFFNITADYIVLDNKQAKMISDADYSFLVDFNLLQHVYTPEFYNDKIFLPDNNEKVDLFLHFYNQMDQLNLTQYNFALCSKAAMEVYSTLIKREQEIASFINEYDNLLTAAKEEAMEIFKQATNQIDIQKLEKDQSQYRQEIEKQYLEDDQEIKKSCFTELENTKRIMLENEYDQELKTIHDNINNITLEEKKKGMSEKEKKVLEAAQKKAEEVAAFELAKKKAAEEAAEKKRLEELAAAQKKAEEEVRELEKKKAEEAAEEQKKIQEVERKAREAVKQIEQKVEKEIFDKLKEVLSINIVGETKIVLLDTLDVNTLPGILQDVEKNHNNNVVIFTKDNMKNLVNKINNAAKAKASLFADRIAGVIFPKVFNNNGVFDSNFIHPLLKQYKIIDDAKKYTSDALEKIKRLFDNVNEKFKNSISSALDAKKEEIRDKIKEQRINLKNLEKLKDIKTGDKLTDIKDILKILQKIFPSASKEENSISFESPIDADGFVRCDAGLKKLIEIISPK